MTGTNFYVNNTLDNTIATGTSKSYLRESNNMSLVLAAACEEGIVVVADSRCTLIEHEEKYQNYQYRDDEIKIWRIPNTNIVITLTGANRLGVEKRPFNQLVSNFVSKTRGSLAEEITRYLLQHNQTEDVTISLFEPCIIPEQEIVMARTVIGFRDEKASITTSFDKQGVIYTSGTTQFVQMVQNFALLTAQNIEDIKAELYKRMELIIQWAQFLPYKQQTIGGEIQTVSVSTTNI